MPASAIKFFSALMLVTAVLSACGGAVATTTPSPSPSASQSEPAATASASAAASPAATASPTASPLPDASEGSIIGAIGTILLITLGALALFLIAALSFLGIKNYTNFRTTIDKKEWILAPAAHIDEVTQVTGLLHDRVATLAQEIIALTSALAERREHIQILDNSITERDELLKKANLGVEHHARQQALRHLALIAEILEVDSRSGIDPKATVGGIRAELEQLLEESGVITYEPKPGEKLPQRGVSLKRVKTVPAEKPAQAGTVKSVESPAYIYAGPNEQEVVLQPMSITVYAAPAVAERE
jgi:hypothetical protein